MLLVFFRPQLNDQNELQARHFTLIDISEQQRDHVKQATLSAIVESSDDAIISKDLNGIITSWNRGAERIFGYSEREALGQPITILIPEERLGEEQNIIASIRNGNRVKHIDTIRLDKNGREIPISVTVSPIKNAYGKIVGASKVARDISDRLQIVEKQAMLSAIVESSDDAIISKNLEGIIMSWNRGAEQLFGYTEAEIVGKSITTLIPKERLNEENIILDRIRNGKKVDHFETVRCHKSGRKFPVSITVSPIRDAKGTVVGASKVARDISVQVESQEAMEKYISNLETLNTVGKSISENLDVQGILQRVTDATTKLTGAAFGAFFYNTTDEKGDSFKLFTLSGAPRETMEQLGMPRHTEMFIPTFVEKKVVRIDDIRKFAGHGKNVPHNGLPKQHFEVVSYLAVPVIAKSGAVIGGLLYGHPEPDVFTAEAELMVVNIAAQAAVSLDNSRLFEQVKSFSDKKDEFIALASHELKTPLTTIKGYLQVLCKKDNDPMSKLFLNKSLYQVEKLNSLIEDLLNMSRIEAGRLDFNLELFDIRELLVEILETFSYSATTHEVIGNLGNEPVLVKGDRQRIEQAVLNLLTNAIKYSPKAEKVYLSLEVAGKRVTVKVRDEGMGLTREQREQLFTRFYRAENTKGISGLGLGLYLTKQIIERHKGEIRVNSEYDKGSEFSFSLPIRTKKMKKEKAV
ncbi:PAS domain S-box protein [Salinimicrobium sp. CDJ15-81-2]|nr:PAS domain S-box protein [Salinimicrobium nanhaiense]